MSVGQGRGRYIVVLDRDVDPENVARAYGALPWFVYRRALNGFAAALPDAAVEALERNPNVEYVEPDGIAYPVQVSSWGLDRIDQRDLALSGSYSPPNGGAGVTVYIIDTGLWASHTDFSGRATNAVSFVDLYDYRPRPDDWDCFGHGTHVAGTIGGTTYGVAKAVRLIGIRVFPCWEGVGAEWSTIVAAVDWVTANAIKPAVVNMSIGGDYSQAVNDAVSGSIVSGISYAVAAGNENRDACLTSPASTPNAVTVGASDQLDRRASFSNWGPCVDLFAPGVFIPSAWAGWDSDNNAFLSCGDTCTASISGTSMASPHVAGALALYLSANPTASPQQARDAVVNAATQGRILDAGAGSPNRLLYVDWTGQQPPSPPPDLSGFSGWCNGFTCTFTGLADGAWDFGDGSSGSGIEVTQKFAPRRKYTVTHTVGSATSTRLVNCNPKKCVVQ